jgi:hypothetical protein
MTRNLVTALLIKEVGVRAEEEEEDNEGEGVWIVMREEKREIYRTN